MKLRSLKKESALPRFSDKDKTNRAKQYALILPIVFSESCLLFRLFFDKSSNFYVRYNNEPMCLSIARD